MCQYGKEIIFVSCEAMIQMSPYKQPLRNIMANITAVISEYLYSSINNDQKYKSVDADNSDLLQRSHKTSPLVNKNFLVAYF